MELFLQFQHCHSVSLERPCYWADEDNDARAAFRKLQQSWKPELLDQPPVSEIPEPPSDPRVDFQKMRDSWTPPPE